MNFRASRKFSEVGVALDAFDGSQVREAHKSNVRSVATAVSIAMTDLMDHLKFGFSPTIFTFLAKTNWCRTVRSLKLGAAGVVVTTMASEEFVATVEDYTSGLSADPKLSSAASLFALSQQKSNDNLRSFIASWSAFRIIDI